MRCDGNKEGCQRCSDKVLSCEYSESRVGKVVGRRRKRPLEDSVGTVDSDTWFINQASAFCAIPSPPESQYSISSKRQRTSDDWTSFLVEEHQDLADFEDSTEVQTNLDVMNPKALYDSSDMSYLCNSGLPTPGMSPPHFRYLSPAALEARPMSRSTSVTTDSSRLLPPRFTPAFSVPKSQTPEPAPSEDDETVCIRLLAHLKKHSIQKGRSSDQDSDLLRKTNASVRRILRNRSVRSDYTCQLLLSSIITHMVDLCEQLCIKTFEAKHLDSTFLQDQARFEPRPKCFDKTSRPNISSDTHRTQIVDATNLATDVANLLKRKPLNGFQVLGRHESHHVELDLRLQRALAMLA